MADNTDSILNKLAVTEIKTQSDYLAEQIRDMIVSRDLPDGYAFPNETEFCKILNVSRGTLREAYKVLDTQGYIRRTKHGTYIKARKEIAEEGDFAASMRLASDEEIIEFVLALEPEAVYLAAEKMDEENIKELEQLLIACEDAIDQDWKIFLDRNYEFHQYIRNMSRNMLIISALAAYYDNFNEKIIQNIYRTNDTKRFRESSLKQHRELFEAIKAKDAHKAKDIERHHLFDDVIENKSKGSGSGDVQ